MKYVIFFSLTDLLSQQPGKARFELEFQDPWRSVPGCVGPARAAPWILHPTPVQLPPIPSVRDPARMSGHPSRHIQLSLANSYSET